ncbi:DEK C terminal domain-containing protein [Thamnocephalis sphaerospora]|uniref:DEK C terminal domain-containing protein n=1 Tax=Thamnocephalis sphaerospora TaxID=78915 RepID=A0A4P9XG30_9FUNG|nr:DEK C terminal domain-containing protein [Thamnocephalis sphaerospora]|eukprot:RKP04566.1 DEK C terminal domain-containing protein [Thamnocephalis sphaerospora]
MARNARHVKYFTTNGCERSLGFGTVVAQLAKVVDVLRRADEAAENDDEEEHGQTGKKFVAATEEEKFDPRSIPRKKWSDYEQELWEVGSQGSHDSRGTALTARTHDSRGSHHSRSGPASEYGGVAGTTTPSVFGMEKSFRMSYQTGSRPVSQTYENRVSMAMTNDNLGHDMYLNQPAMVGRPASTTFSAYGAPSVVMDQGHDPNGYPSDDQILGEIRRILSTADLMTVTKKQVRDELAAFFGVDMMPKKDYINQCIELILQGKL